MTKRQQLVRLASDTAPPARLWVVPIGGAPTDAKAVTQAPRNVLDAPSWSPDGSSIAYVHSASTTAVFRRNCFCPAVMSMPKHHALPSPLPPCRRPDARTDAIVAHGAAELARR